MTAEPRIVLVAACGRNRVIGRDGGMPWHLPEDFAHFKRTTMGHPMILGRRTWESFGSKPLPGRPHIVLTRSADFAAPGAAAVVHSWEDAVSAASAELGDGDTIMVVGGGEVYAMALPHADEVILSELDAAPEGDTVFPELDAAQWTEVSREQRTGFDIVTYQRRG